MEKQLHIIKNGSLGKHIQKFIWFLFALFFSHADVKRTVFGWVKKEGGEKRHGISSKLRRMKRCSRFLNLICFNNIYVLYFKVGLSYPPYTYALTTFFALEVSNLLIHTNIKPHVTLGRYVFILNSKFNF